MSALPPFQNLLDAHADAVMAVLRGAVGRADAEDCFQETFLAALRAYPDLRDGRNLRGWLLTIAHRKAIDHHRARGRRPVPMADAEPAGGEARQAVASPVGADLAGGNGLGPHGEMPDEDGIWALVAGLPPKQRAAVALRYACDLPHAEIAAALGCSPQAARRSLHEGMRRLRADFGGDRAGPGMGVGDRQGVRPRGNPRTAEERK